MLFTEEREMGIDSKYEIKRIGLEELEPIKTLFLSVFTKKPWNDDWSDTNQLNMYLDDLIGQNNSLTYGIYKESDLIGVSMGQIRHWYTGTEYYIAELCIKTEKQGKGIGTLFLEEIHTAIKQIGISHIFLQTESDVPAYRFYLKNGYHELKTHVSFAKQV
jgi:aminoglycoside 6'-N-acetyltransferase I